MNQQKKNITKTVAILVFIMVSFLAMFLHKIMTPRYLSNIELKVNGLILAETPQALSVEINSNISDHWVLLIDGPKHRHIVNELRDSLKPKLRDQLDIIEQSTLKSSSLALNAESIAIFGHEHVYKGYFVPPYDVNKMKLTLSSVMTHR